MDIPHPIDIIVSQRNEALNAVAHWMARALAAEAELVKKKPSAPPKAGVLKAI